MVREVARRDVQRRMAGLYVDYDAGSISRPSDISEDEAQNMIDEAAALLVVKERRD